MYIGSGVCEDRQIDRPPEELSNRFKLTSQAFFPFVCRLLPGEAIPAACLRARAKRYSRLASYRVPDHFTPLQKVWWQ